MSAGQRNEIIKYAEKKYKTAPEYPWLKYPDYAVLRRSDNRKWFAVIMNIRREKLGLPGSEKADIINVKTDPLMQGSVLMSEGIFPAYHMNKANWVSVLLDGTVDTERITLLLDMSFKLTGGKKGKR